MKSQRQGEDKPGASFVRGIEDESTSHQLCSTTNESKTDAKSFAVIVEFKEWDEDATGILFRNTYARVGHDEMDVPFVFQPAFQRDESFLCELVGIVKHLLQHLRQCVRDCRNGQRIWDTSDKFQLDSVGTFEFNFGKQTRCLSAHLSCSQERKQSAVYQ